MFNAHFLDVAGRRTLYGLGQGRARVALQTGEEVGALLGQQVQAGPHVGVQFQVVHTGVQELVIVVADDPAHPEDHATCEARRRAQELRQAV